MRLSLGWLRRRRGHRSCPDCGEQVGASASCCPCCGFELIRATRDRLPTRPI